MKHAPLETSKQHLQCFGEVAILSISVNRFLSNLEPMIADALFSMLESDPNLKELFKYMEPFIDMITGLSALLFPYMIFLSNACSCQHLTILSTRTYTIGMNQYQVCMVSFYTISCEFFHGNVKSSEI